MKALTYGVKIRRHGKDPEFRAQVNRFAQYFEQLHQQEQSTLEQNDICKSATKFKESETVGTDEYMIERKEKANN